jgi:hypothetical protein
MSDADPKTFTRHGRHPVTKVIEPVVVARVTGLRRRVTWRLRELDTDLAAALRSIDYPGGRTSMWHIIKKAERRGTMTKASFDALTAALRMDEVDGWRRPWPPLPPRSERRSLAEVVMERLTGAEPGEG